MSPSHHYVRTECELRALFDAGNLAAFVEAFARASAEYSQKSFREWGFNDAEIDQPRVREAFADRCYLMTERDPHGHAPIVLECDL